MHWIKRYVPGEFWGTLSAVLGGMVAGYYTNNVAIIGYVGAWSENIGYYGYFIRKEYHDQRLFHNIKVGFWSLVKGVVAEFGPGEILDSLIIRPFCMGFGVKLFPTGGLLLGKLAADVIFYIPATLLFRHKTKKRIHNALNDLQERIEMNITKIDK